MGKLELNLDAYRLIADLLYRLRATIRESLRGHSGERWEECIPEDLRLFLTQRRMREQAVSWFRVDSSDLLEYAGFSDLAEILTANPMLLEHIDWLPATDRQAMIRVRFLELDTVFQRVAYARPVSEMEMELLTGLGERLRKSLDTQGTRAPQGTGPEEKAPETKERPPGPQAPQTLPAPQETPAPKKDTGKRPSPSTKEALLHALEIGDTKTILASLYREVVSTADAIFKEGTPPACPVWETVRESPWYAQNFRPLSLAPLSHFFDIVEDAKALARETNREELLEALRNRGFAQTLLQLKELFQPYVGTAG